MQSSISPVRKVEGAYLVICDFRDVAVARQPRPNGTRAHLVRSRPRHVRADNYVVVCSLAFVRVNRADALVVGCFQPVGTTLGCIEVPVRGGDHRPATGCVP